MLFFIGAKIQFYRTWLLLITLIASNHETVRHKTVVGEEDFFSIFLIHNKFDKKPVNLFFIKTQNTRICG